MVNLSPELEAEIRRQAAELGDMPIEDFLREALKAFSRERALEDAILEGFDGEEIPVTSETIAQIREEGLALLRKIQGH